MHAPAIRLRKRPACRRGPDDCIDQANIESGRVLDTSDGGIWLSKNPGDGRPARAYFHEFSGKTYRAGDGSQKPNASSVDSAWANQAIMNALQGTSPVVAGLGAGIATGLIGAFVEDAKIKKRMDLIDPELSREPVFKAMKKPG